jgi:ABC-2 type transport system permease protein
MIATLFAEFRKLLSIRSTYILSGVGLLLAGFLSFWGTGYKGGPIYMPNALQNAASDGVSIVSIFVGIVAILLICHEYRYNTISYTLTASNSRLKVLLAKFLVVAGYSLVMTLITIVLSIALVTWGAHIAGNSLGTQTIDVYPLLWKTLAYMIGGAWLGLILGFLSRSVVFAIIVYFVLPAIEPILHGLLKVSNNYMPSATQAQILQTTSSPDVFSPLASAGVFGLYLLGTFIVATVLFMRRDAN